MQNAYFLGGASPEGFETDFWRANAQRGHYGIYLKGGPGTGKSTLMKKIAAAFADEPVSVYHCASDPHSLDAVVLESRGVFIADATAPHEAGTPLPYVTGELADLAAGLDPALLKESAEPIRTLYQANQAAHMQARKGLAGIAAMEEQLGIIGRRALLPEKLKHFADRLAKRILPKKSCSGDPPACEILHRQRIAVTPAGRRAFLPEACALMLLDDPAQAASGMLLSLLAEAAAAQGQPAELTHSQTQPDRAPVLLALPAQQLVLAAADALPSEPAQSPVSVIHMQRFYDAEQLRSQRTLLRFSKKTASALEAKTVSLLADALRLHDELEAYYIRALQTPYLDRKAAALTERLRGFPQSV